MIEENFEYDEIENETIQETGPDNPAKILVDKAEGFYLFDEDGKSYLDLTSNCDYMPVGFSTKQKKNLSGFYETTNLITNNSLTLETLISKSAGLEKSYFFPEKQFAFDFVKNIVSTKPEKSVLLATSEQDPFGFTGKEALPLTLNDISAVKTFLSKKTEAVVIEISQIKNSLTIAEIDYLKLIKDYCDKNHVLLVYDTCSISPLRLNRGLFNFDDSIKPDVMIASKGLTTGGQLYIVSCKKEIAEKITTANSYEIYSSNYSEAIDFLQNSSKYKTDIEINSKYLEEKFNKLAEVHAGLADCISYGMLFGIVTEIPSEKLVKQALSKGLLINPLNEYTVLLAPPYCITKKEIDQTVKIFGELFNEFTKYDHIY